MQTKSKSKTIIKQPLVDERTAELQAQYAPHFARRGGGGHTRMALDPCEVSTDWATPLMARAEVIKAGIKSGYPAGYIQRPLGRLADLTPHKLDNARLNIASMTASRMTPAAISDVLRIVEEDVAAELKRQRREEP